MIKQSLQPIPQRLKYIVGTVFTYPLIETFNESILGPMNKGQSFKIKNFTVEKIWPLEVFFWNLIMTFFGTYRDINHRSTVLLCVDR